MLFRSQYLYASILTVFLLLTLKAEAQQNLMLPRFGASPYFNEQELIFNFDPEVKITINAPSPAAFDKNKPTEIIFFALPNGNTTDQTIGKIMEPGDDWHYDIQHIGAQTRFVREHDKSNNIVTVYLETAQKSWPSWRSKYSNNAALVKSIVDSVKNIFAKYNPFTVLTGHSGGGGFTFSYMAAVQNIPDEIKRISFLDSDYNYDDTYGSKLKDWLNASDDHYLCVIAYNDSVALYNGAPIVSPTGGTWYRSKLMEKYLSNYFTFSSEEDSSFIRYTALNGRIKFFLKKNPERAILHTVQVDLNGFIEGIFSGTQYEGTDYTYYGPRAYPWYIQKDVPLPPALKIPPRPAGALGGMEFMKKVENMTFDQREEEIYNEVSKGNIPDFLRHTIRIKTTASDAAGKQHTVYYEVMPDYLAVGSNTDYCRIPTGPITAQKLGLLFGANLPTSKMVDDIYVNSTCKLAPVFYPWSDTSTMVIRFIQHSVTIDSQRAAAGGILGELTGGIQKDVVLSNKIAEKPNNVVIYGWHQLNGQPIQPLYNGHINWYLDYSHGIRYINNEVLVDSTLMTIPQILKDPVLYKILSNENGPMIQPGYLSDTALPVQPKSFGIKNGGTSSLKIIIKPDTSVKQYYVYLSGDGLNFGQPLVLNPNDLTISNLKTDSLYFVKIKAVNSAGESPESEVLAGIPSSPEKTKSIIVNGFDRASAGNTHNFIRQHGRAFYNNDDYFDSATNDAVTGGLFNLNDYANADYILGDESTADETFSNSEQEYVRDFLKNGGNLFVSGSEIAWDLDYKGAVSDKNFAAGYLKMKYVADAPNNQPDVYYGAQSLNGSLASGLPAFNYDNGTHGTFDVKWPDIIKPVNGSIAFMQFTGVDTASGICGINYKGVFPGGTRQGSLVLLTFPFETIYPETAADQLMGKVSAFFDSNVSSVQNKDVNVPGEFRLFQNYPNPFNPSTRIRYSLASNSHVSLTIYDELGRQVRSLVDTEQSKGSHTINFNASRLASGIYFYILKAGDYSAVKKMVVLK